MGLNSCGTIQTPSFVLGVIPILSSISPNILPEGSEKIDSGERDFRQVDVFYLYIISYFIHNIIFLLLGNCRFCVTLFRFSSPPPPPPSPHIPTTSLFFPSMASHHKLPPHQPPFFLIPIPMWYVLLLYKRTIACCNTLPNPVANPLSMHSHTRSHRFYGLSRKGIMILFFIFFPLLVFIPTKGRSGRERLLNVARSSYEYLYAHAHNGTCVQKKVK